MNISKELAHEGGGDELLGVSLLVSGVPPAGPWRGTAYPIPLSSGDGSLVSFQVGWLLWLMAC